MRSSRFPFFFGLLLATVSASAAQGLQDSRSVSKTHQRRNAPLQQVILSGEVVTDDGSPLPEMLEVQLVCNGRVNQTTVVAPDGSFTFTLGEPRTDDWVDPSLGGSLGGSLESVVKVAPPGRSAKLDEVPSLGPGRADLRGCEIRLPPAPDLVANAIALDARNALENPDVGRIVVRRSGGPSARTVSVSFLSAPKKARQRYEEAVELARRAKPRWKDAEKKLREALKVYPEFAAAWDLLGRVLMTQEKRDEGKAAFERAVELEPAFLPPREALAQAAVQEADWPRLREVAEALLELDPNHSRGLYWSGMACFYLRDFGPGVTRLQQLYAGGGEAEFPFGLLLLGVMQANQGDLPGAAASLRKYLDLMPPDQVPPEQRQELERQLAQWRAEGVVPATQ
ncbi:MAG: hypothetical protein Kow00109_25160 [Acidobacteriota bacterium]